MNTLSYVLCGACFFSLLIAAMVGVTAMLFKMIAKEENEIVEAMTSEPEEKENLKS